MLLSFRKKGARPLIGSTSEPVDGPLSSSTRRAFCSAGLAGAPLRGATKSSTLLERDPLKAPLRAA